MEAHIESFASRISVLEAHLAALKEAVAADGCSTARMFDEREKLSLSRLQGLEEHFATVASELAERKSANNQVAVLSSQIDCLRVQLMEQIAARKSATEISFSASDKATLAAQATADAALRKAEGAADKHYLESRIVGLQNAVESQIINQKDANAASLTSAREALTAAMAASEKAISKAEAASEKRFEGVNEWRSTVGDIQSKLLPRVEADQRFGSIGESINKLEQFRATQQGAASHGESSSRLTMAIVAILVTAVLSVGGTILTVSTRPNDADRDRQQLKETLAGINARIQQMDTAGPRYLPTPAPPVPTR